MFPCNTILRETIIAVDIADEDYGFRKTSFVVLLLKRSDP